MKKFLSRKQLVVAIILGFVVTNSVWASGGDSHNALIGVLIALPIILIAAKLGAALMEKIGQPAVLGELIAGVVIGNLAILGLHWFEPFKEDIIIRLLAELGVLILLLQVGLESNINEMKKVGLKALLVAIIGVIVPFVLGTWLVGPYLLPGNSFNFYLFLGAALTATSVGITARVFKDTKTLKSPEAKIVLGAAVIDDVIGLIILAVVSAIVVSGTISIAAVGLISLKALLFLAGSIVVGIFAAPLLGKALSKIHPGIGMKFTLVICFALLYSYFAALLGLAPIVGAFAAGLVLDPVHFRYFKKSKIVEELSENGAGDISSETLNKHNDHHIEELIEPIGFFLIPIFFVVTGMSVDLTAFLDGKIIGAALVITLVAFVGKIASGIVAGKGVNKLIVGIGMIPRGEVGLIFATIGMTAGVFDANAFSLVVIMVILTTLLTPPILNSLLKRSATKLSN